MSGPLPSKLHSRRGIAGLIVILLVAVIVLAVVCMIPFYKKYQRQGQIVACATALDTARRQLAVDFMFNGFESGKADEAKELISKVMLGWEDLCPEGGNVYITANPKNPVAWDIVCGLHASDSKLRTRLNAGNVREQLEEALLKERNRGNLYPETLPFTLHHKDYLAQLVDEPTGLKRGTKTTMGMEKAGIVAYYGLKGHGELGADSKAEPGEMVYFCFADEEHCANWDREENWTGDSYAGVS